MAWTYTSKIIVANFSKVPEGDLVDVWSTWAESLIDHHLGASYTGVQTYTEEMHDGDDTRFLFVNHPPIVSVTALSIGGGDMVDSDYKVYETYIELVNLVNDNPTPEAIFPVGVGNVLISYTGLSGTVPGYVQLCATQMISMIALVNQREGADGSLKYSRVTQTQGDTVTTTSQVGLQKALMDIMDKYLPPKVRVF
jgi:hypothetical protein